MDTLHNYMVSSPLPCVYFVISDREQMKIYSVLSSFNKNKNPSKNERFYLKVVEKDKINQSTTNYANWFEKVVEEPTCVVYCSDWQIYKVESSKVLGTEMVNDPNLVDILSKSPGSDGNINKEQSKKDTSDKKEESEVSEPNLIRITNKNLEKLIREDIENFLLSNRKTNENKSVSHKFLLLITLNKNIKNPNKVIGSLKNLDPSEVCAVCVSCGMTDINSKLEKLEQMIYETSISYYEKKIKRLMKLIVNIKSHTKVTMNEITEMYYILLNFKLGYYSEFLMNRKEAYSKYIICWNSLKQTNMTKSLIDKTSLSFFICLRMLDYLFYASDISSTFTIYLEYKDYIEALIMNRYRGLYYNLIYLVNYFIAYKLEQCAMLDEKNSSVLMHQASNYYKWTVSYLVKLRKHILYLSNPMEFDKKNQMYKVNVVDESYNQELYKSKGMNRKYYLPCDLNNVFYYEDADYGLLYDEKNHGTDEITESEFEFRGDKLEVHQVLEEDKLESETLKLAMKTCKVYKNLNHSNHLLFIYAQLGDSFYLSNNCREALRIYIITLRHILYDMNFTQNYAALIRKYSTPSETKNEGYVKERLKTFHYIHVIHMLVYSELVCNNLQKSLYINVLCKVILSILMLLNVEQIPSIIYELSNLPNNDSNNLNLSASKDSLEDIVYEDQVTKDCVNKETEMYMLVLLKCLTTLISIYNEENSMVNYLNYIVDFFNKSPTNKVKNNKFDYNDDVKYESTKKMTKTELLNEIDKLLSEDSEGKEETIEKKCEPTRGVSSEAMVENLESYILLSKHSKSQYIYKYDNEMLEIIINFQTDVNISLSFSEGHLDTSEGLLSFYFKTSQYSSDTFIIYTNQVSEVNGQMKEKGNMVELPNNKRIIMIIQLEFYTIKSFKIYGIILKTYYRDKMLINSIVLTNQYVINNYFKKLYYVINLGYYTSQLHLTNHFSNNRDYKDGNTLANLIYLSLNKHINNTFLEVDGCNAIDILELMKLMNMNMKMKVFIKNVVRNFMSPITIVLLYNKRFAHLYNRFAYKLQVEHDDFYVFGKEENEYVLCKSSEIEFDFNESVMDGMELAMPENIKLKQLCAKYRLYNYSNMKESEMDAIKLEEEMVKYINIYKNNYNIHVLYGLINANNDMDNNVKLNLHIKDLNKNDEGKESPVRDTEKLLKKEKRGNILLYSKIVDINVNTIININVNYKYYNDNGMLLYINLINNTDIIYQLLKVNILYNNHILTNNNIKLHGFSENINANENLNFVCVLDDYKRYNAASVSENSIQIQIIKYIQQKLYYPFNHMKNFLKFTINKFISLAEVASDKIQLKMNHQYIATMGAPIELKAQITNATNETMEYEVTLTDENKDDEKPFILQGPLNMSLVALPNSSDTLKWTLIPTRCKIFKVPMVQVLNKLDFTKNTKAVSISSQIYVVP